MIISRHRIRNLERYFQMVPNNTAIILAMPLATVTSDRRSQIGFLQALEVNSAVLPAPAFGPVSSFNANGREDVHSDQPLETVCRSVYSRWNDWHGNPHSGWVTRSYERRPRTFVPPPSVEFRISATVDGEQLITSDQINYEPANHNEILHRVNLFLEVFGECHVLTQNLERIIQTPVRRLNWQVLPPGQRPFAQLRRELDLLIREEPEQNQPLIADRLETINGLGPTFVAVGQAGFNGYVVFGFTDRQLFLFESIFFGNATYVFGENWAALSQLSKAEILNENLALHRVIHKRGWHQEIHRLLR